MRWILVAGVALLGCSPGEPDARAAEFRRVALEFAQALAARDYPKAHAMMSAALRARMTVDQLRDSFERIVPLDWGPVGPVAVGETMTTWPDKEPGDLGWAYVGIGGAVHSEAVIVVVALEHGQPRIRQVEFGRP